jgi:CBS domain-containing protein
MAEANIGAVIVTDTHISVVGIFSERDYARKVLDNGVSPLDIPVKEFMTDRVCYVDPDRSVDECMALVTEKRCRHLPVLENGKLIGIVSIGDLVKASISEKELLINQLTRYIQSNR